MAVTTQALTLSQAGEKYLDYIQMVSSSNATLRNARWIVNQVVRYLDDRFLNEVSPSDFLRFQVDASQRLSHDSTRTAIGYIKSFSGWMVAEGLTGRDLGGLMRKPKRQKREIATIGKEALKAILAHAREDEPPALSVGIHLLALAGIRLNEACGLNRDDIDLDQATLTVREGKGGYSRRVIPLHANLAEELRKYLSARDVKPSDALLLDRGRPLADYTLRRAVERVGKEAGVKATPQLLRRSIATLLHAQGARIETVGALLGHTPSTNAVTLNHYVSPSTDEMRAMIDALRV